MLLRNIKDNLVEKVAVWIIENQRIGDGDVKLGDIISTLDIELDSDENKIVLSVVFNGEDDPIVLAISDYRYDSGVFFIGLITTNASWINTLLKELVEFPLKINIPENKRRMVKRINEYAL